MDLTKSENVKTLMSSSKTSAEWNANCDKVKAANGGYPGWWYETVVMSGLAGQTSAKFQK